MEGRCSDRASHLEGRQAAGSWNEKGKSTSMRMMELILLECIWIWGACEHRRLRFGQCYRQFYNRQQREVLWSASWSSSPRFKIWVAWTSTLLDNGRTLRPCLARWLYTRWQRQVRVSKGFLCSPFGRYQRLREGWKSLAPSYGRLGRTSLLRIMLWKC